MWNAFQIWALLLSLMKTEIITLSAWTVKKKFSHRTFNFVWFCLKGSLNMDIKGVIGVFCPCRVRFWLPLEEGMATYSSILTCRIPQTEEPGELQSMGSQKVGHDWACTHISVTWTLRLVMRWTWRHLTQFSGRGLPYLLYFGHPHSKFITQLV